MNTFENFKFQYEFRKHQQMILDSFERKIKLNQNKVFKFHIVSPPGSGKTIVGLEIAKRLGMPTLVICPNTTIQGQWTEKYKMFLSSDASEELKNEITISAQNLKSINVFTYQMLSLPCGDNDDLIRVSENLWAETVSESQNVSIDEALLRICTMKNSNPKAYKTEIAKFNKKLRQNYLNEGDCNLSNILHTNTIKLINDLKQCNIKTVIFDECHHLQSYWALVMKEVIMQIGVLNIIGLTATPPIDEDKEKIDCYTSLLGEIDYQIPTPAVIKEGMLAPFQDLVYFCTPTTIELDYIQNCHQKFKMLIDRFNKRDSDFYFWVIDRIVNRKLISGEIQEWTKFINSKPNYAIAGVKYLLQFKYTLPWDITITETMYEQMLLEDWIYLIEDYALNLLKLSSDENDNKLLLEIKDALRTLGFILTEKGVMKNSSPLDRVLAYSKSKLSAVKEILKTEIEAIGDKIRVAIITEFEISNATSLKSVESIIDDECGGAISVIKELVSDSATDMLDPVMVTGNSLICDDDLAEEYITLGLQWAREQLLDINLSLRTIEFDKFISVEGSGNDWSSRTAVLLTTYLFEAGVTKCIIGTRGLLGEGWDSLNLNTLIDLSVVTTYSSVNQLRGRSIRKSEADPRKISNNWDVICIAPDMEKGYNDLDRLYRKHSQFYGICDDGQIQFGVNHVDPALAICDKKLGDLEVQSINKKMLNAASDREKAYDAWKIGEPFDNVELGCSEIKLLKPIKMKAGSVFVSERSILKNKILANVFKFSGTVASTSLAGIIATTMIPAAIPLLLFSGFLGIRTYLGIKDMWRYGKDNFFSLSIKSSINDMARCTLNALVECELISPEIKEKDIVITERADGTIRVFLNCKDKDSNIFSTALSQIFTPIESQRYAIQRFEVFVPESGLDKFIYLFRYGINKYSPLLACYHPIPDLFGIKEKALVFKKYWNKYVSPGDVVFLKGGKGQEILEKFGRINSLGAKKMNMKIWK